MPYEGEPKKNKCISDRDRNSHQEIEFLFVELLIYNKIIVTFIPHFLKITMIDYGSEEINKYGSL